MKDIKYVEATVSKRGEADVLTDRGDFRAFSVKIRQSFLPGDIVAIVDLETLKGLTAEQDVQSWCLHRDCGVPVPSSWLFCAEHRVRRA